VTGKPGEGLKQLSDNFKEVRGYLKIAEEALDLTLFRTPFGGDCRKK
jgi:hypothetical protein